MTTPRWAIPAYQSGPHRLVKINLALQVPYTRRRRECVGCGHRFTTAERIVDPALLRKGGQPMADAVTIRRVVRQSAPGSARQVAP